MTSQRNDQLPEAEIIDDPNASIPRESNGKPVFFESVDEASHDAPSEEGATASTDEREPGGVSRWAEEEEDRWDPVLSDTLAIESRYPPTPVGDPQWPFGVPLPLLLVIGGGLVLLGLLYS